MDTSYNSKLVGLNDKFRTRAPILFKYNESLKLPLRGYIT